MLPLLSLHALAAQRGDGLRAELLALFERHARAKTGLSAAIEPVETEPLYQAGNIDTAAENRGGTAVAMPGTANVAES
ncbi:hypothetical protein AWB69_01732 [Caballeronia udeis]|uniref:Uncharacterized protein n=1 Tax=Caballeronia udeis TaxID=1232866 RepID=A0A158FWY6_9BURK|nr:hypothetical protein [Caballeronia udeis]SAL24131.1 hypothetical protein AWB69_01732 [Caballeronia udeis]